MEGDGTGGIACYDFFPVAFVSFPYSSFLVCVCWEGHPRSRESCAAGWGGVPRCRRGRGCHAMGREWLWQFRAAGRGGRAALRGGGGFVALPAWAEVPRCRRGHAWSRRAAGHCGAQRRAAGRGGTWRRQRGGLAPRSRRWRGPVVAARGVGLPVVVVRGAALSVVVMHGPALPVVAVMLVAWEARATRPAVARGRE
ncbi:hypothetical protein I4F81_012531 [Pyropia yezoensis]|uniref:Uncharacterized protein n=1 Tax=Pyropia yezoensis TaxID=2788 RepID=A0ACC3CJS8_PYRYE|nr:hypothetical protein I4F81_012531 [Neopyropia yezoensis]